VRAEIRAMLDGKKPGRPRGNRGVAQIRIKSVPKHAYVGWVIDQQTKEELDARELAAKIAVYRHQQRIAKAQVTSEKCSHKACPFLAVLDGECRRHALDRTADFSVLPSQLAAARELADY
jgi:hypothetical protein